jgi:soluble lytic murein transglycosylase
MLAWQVRSALRSPGLGDERWLLVAGAIDAMGPAEQKDPSWVYWKARALQARAKPGTEGDADRQAARQMLASIAGQMHFYGKLATEELGGTLELPTMPTPPTSAEREFARRNPGFERALLLIGIGLRNEGVREWNFTLRGLGDRELLAAAQVACEREVWDRCINTSDRTRVEVDMAQRFPMPYRKDVVSQAREIGIDPAYIYGLIRQESRFIMDARSSVGASGLMQIMPTTARWTARKIGLDYKPEMITDREVNLKLGTAYLKLVLDDFQGSQAMAAAAYNAGPGRPRRWREGAIVEPAAWAENIPFAETRDYVKKVLSNAVYYSALMGNKPVSLKARLGPPIGPRDANAPTSDRDLP